MTTPDDQADTIDQQAIENWLAELSALLPASALDEVGTEERQILLDLARIAARRSHRTAAPITTYVIGLALAALPCGARLSTMRAIVGRLEGSSG